MKDKWTLEYEYLQEEAYEENSKSLKMKKPKKSTKPKPVKKPKPTGY